MPESGVPPLRIHFIALISSFHLDFEGNIFLKTLKKFPLNLFIYSSYCMQLFQKDTGYSAELSDLA